MNEQAKTLSGTTMNGRWSFEQTQEFLQKPGHSELEIEALEDLQLDREAAATFVADQATLLSAVAHAAGLSTVKIISDLLYVNAFGDVGAAEVQ